MSVAAYDYTAFKASITDKISRFGQDVIVRAISAGAYDPATGTNTTTSSDTTRKGLVFEPTGDKEGNDLIKDAEKDLYLEASTPAPELDDKIVIGGTTYEILSIKTIGPSGQALAFHLELRS